MHIDLIPINPPVIDPNEPDLVAAHHRGTSPDGVASTCRLELARISPGEDNVLARVRVGREGASAAHLHTLRRAVTIDRE